MIEKHGVHTITELASVWELPLPDTALPHTAAVDVVQNEAGSRIDVDSAIQTNVPSILISFGLDEHSGVARYSWLEEEEDNTSTSISSGSNQVTINVTQNGGTAPTGTTF